MGPAAEMRQLTSSQMRVSSPFIIRARRSRRRSPGLPRTCDFSPRLGYRRSHHQPHTLSATGPCAAGELRITPASCSPRITAPTLCATARRRVKAEPSRVAPATALPACPALYPPRTLGPRLSFPIPQVASCRLCLLCGTVWRVALPRGQSCHSVCRDHISRRSFALSAFRYSSICDLSRSTSDTAQAFAWSSACRSSRESLSARSTSFPS